ncbi:SREC-like protein, partial [Mya arenaria]
MWDCRHVGFIYFVMYLNRFYSSPHFNGYKVYIENLTSWGYEDDDRNYIPRNTSRSLCYQHDGSEITNRTMVVQCVKTLIGNSVRIEMANKYSQLVLCDIKISADGFLDSGVRIEVSIDSTNCPENFCGYNCSVPCHCRIPGPMKDKLTAVCTSGCAGRATGRNGLCNHVCSNTTWGEECTYQCGHCNNGESCNASNGHCKTCTAGYKPTPKCEDECDLGKYGLNCSRNCGHCGLELDCEKVSGNCSAGCDAGWNGTLCDQECENGTYGSNCSETCGNCVAGCKKGTGTCLGGCLSGFKGETCKYI